MKYSIDRHSRESAYMQLYSQLKADLISGLLPYGSRLPSKRLLAEELGVSLITVEHACALLVDEGYAEARERSGCYAAFGGEPGIERPIAPLLTHTAPLLDAPADFPFSVWAKTMRRVLSDYDRRILAKVPGCGCIELRQALSGYLARSRGLSVAPEQIVIGAGAEYLYSLIAQLLGRQSAIALENPSYQRIRQVYESNGAQCLPLPMGEDGILPSALRDCAAKALHVTPFNSYPSGVTATAARRRDYAQWARERESIIIEDDYDSEFSAVTRRIETVFSLAPERVIYLNTFTKTLAPAMRTAYMVLPERLLGEYDARLGFYSCTVPVFEQYVLAEFISRGELERYINRRRRMMRREAQSDGKKTS